MNRAALLAEILDRLPTNNAGEITASDVRAVLGDIVSSCVNIDDDKGQAGGSAGLDASGFVPVTQMPMTNDQARAALSTFTGSSGVLVGGANWLTVVQDDLAANFPLDTSATNIRFNGVFWPIGGAAWTYVRTVLKAYFSWDDATADARIDSVQTLAKTSR